MINLITGASYQPTKSQDCMLEKLEDRLDLTKSQYAKDSKRFDRFFLSCTLRKTINRCEEVS